MNTQQVCEHEDCTSLETQAYRYPDGSTIHLCANHAATLGFCLWCQQPGGVQGWHEDCWQECQEFEYEGFGDYE